MGLRVHVGLRLRPVYPNREEISGQWLAQSRILC